MPSIQEEALHIVEAMKRNSFGSGVVTRNVADTRVFSIREDYFPSSRQFTFQGVWQALSASYGAAWRDAGKDIAKFETSGARRYFGIFTGAIDPLSRKPRGYIEINAPSADSLRAILDVMENELLRAAGRPPKAGPENPSMQKTRQNDTSLPPEDATKALHRKVRGIILSIAHGPGTLEEKAASFHRAVNIEFTSEEQAMGEPAFLGLLFDSGKEALRHEMRQLNRVRTAIAKKPEADKQQEISRKAPPRPRQRITPRRVSEIDWVEKLFESLSKLGEARER